MDRYLLAARVWKQTPRHDQNDIDLKKTEIPLNKRGLTKIHDKESYRRVNVERSLMTRQGVSLSQQRGLAVLALLSRPGRGQQGGGVHGRGVAARPFAARGGAALREKAAGRGAGRRWTGRAAARDGGDVGGGLWALAVAHGAAQRAGRARCKVSCRGGLRGEEGRAVLRRGGHRAREERGERRSGGRGQRGFRAADVATCVLGRQREKQERGD